MKQEFSNIIRRAFATRLFPPEVVDKLGKCFQLKQLMYIIKKSHLILHSACTWAGFNGIKLCIYCISTQMYNAAVTILHYKYRHS